METEDDLHPQIDPEADVRAGVLTDHAPMTTTDYLLDSTLVLLVLLQIKERPLSTKAIVRPIVIVGVAVASYFHSVPTSGNDLVLISILGLTGLTIGIASGVAVRMRPGAYGEVLARGGWASAFLGAGHGLTLRLPGLDQPRRLLRHRQLQRRALDHRRGRLD